MQGYTERLFLFRNEFNQFTNTESEMFDSITSKTCPKRPLKNRQNKGLKDKW